MNQRPQAGGNTQTRQLPIGCDKHAAGRLACDGALIGCGMLSAGGASFRGTLSLSQKTSLQAMLESSLSNKWDLCLIIGCIDPPPLRNAPLSANEGLDSATQ